MCLYEALSLTIEVDTVKRAEALQTAEAALHQAGFQISRKCTARNSCFDFAARRDERLVFIKAFLDIRDVSRSDATEIKRVSRCFSCASLFISDMKDEEMLRDDTVYSRYGVYVITSKTLEDIVLRGALPLVKAAPGGYSVKIDGGKIIERRHEVGLSIGKLAEMIGVSRRSLYGYERNMARASVTAAYHLEKILGVPIVKTIDIFEPPSRSATIRTLSLSSFMKIRNRFLRSILGKLVNCGFDVSPISRAPFDFTANCPDVQLKILGGVFSKRERSVGDRIEEIVSLSRIIEAKPLLVGEQKTSTPEDVAFLSSDELDRIGNRKDLTALF